MCHPAFGVCVCVYVLRSQTQQEESRRKDLERVQRAREAEIKRQQELQRETDAAQALILNRGKSARPKLAFGIANKPTVEDIV